MSEPEPATIQLRSAGTPIDAPRDALRFAAAMVEECARSRGCLDYVVFLIAEKKLSGGFPRLDAAVAKACMSLAYLDAISRSPELFWRDGPGHEAAA